MRDYRFDVVRVVCMTYIVAYFHLYGYVYLQGQPAIDTAIAHACLGLFTFVSGYLLGKKYCFGHEGNVDVWTFYKKRMLRIVPLFLISSVALWLIGFNGAQATMNGLLCISPFVNPRPGTMYYIPIILWCYLVTPLLSRHGLRWRVCGCVLLFGLLFIASLIFPSIDRRFVFNVFFYFVGIVSASCFDWRFTFPHGTSIKVFSVLFLVCLLAVSSHYSLLNTNLRQMALGGIGVFVILFICEGISKLGGRQFFNFVSYASMACYLFHRFFYWVAEAVWNPTDTTIKWLYMAGVVYPIIIVLSYGIQKLYDKLVKKTNFM